LANVSQFGAEIGDRELPGPGAVNVSLWTTFEDDTAADRVFAEVARAVGVGPPMP
jgi:hypothetical protein